jgi:hypothetical protein
MRAETRAAAGQRSTVSKEGLVRSTSVSYAFPHATRHRTDMTLYGTLRLLSCGRRVPGAVDRLMEWGIPDNRKGGPVDRATPYDSQPLCNAITTPLS